MASTDKYNIGPDAWTQVSFGERNVGVQLGGTANVMVHVAEADPAINAAGVIVGTNSPDLPQDFSLAGLPEGAFVYVKAQENPTTVVVIKY